MDSSLLLINADNKNPCSSASVTYRAVSEMRQGVEFLTPPLTPNPGVLFPSMMRRGT
jgi:hypothetical protein